MAANCRAIRFLSYHKESHDCKREDLLVVEKQGDSTIAFSLYPKLSNDRFRYATKEVIAVTANQAKLRIYTYSISIKASIKGGV